MRTPQANIDILRHIAKYCENIEALIQRFGKDAAAFKEDMAYHDAVSMNILQIGELANHLSEEYRRLTKEKMPWAAIRAMRNLFAHNYGQMDLAVIWKTATEDIPELKKFCEEQIRTSELLQDESLEFDYDDDEDLEI